MAAAGPAQAHYATLVRRDLQPALKAAGFKKTRMTFHRRHPSGVVDVIQLQGSDSSTARELRFTVNVSRWSPLLHHALSKLGWAPAVGELPTEPDCQLRRRIGSFLAGKRDTWWKVTTSAPRDLVDVRDAIVAKALPFLDSLQTDEQLRDALLRRRISLDPLERLALFARLGPKAALEKELAPLEEELERPSMPRRRAQELRRLLDRARGLASSSAR